MPPRGGGGGGGGKWQHGLCGCFENCTLCVITYFAPCYVAGKTAEKVGESCCFYCCMTVLPIANIICLTKLRGIIREQRHINGSCLNDCCLVWFCSCCALIQEAREVNAIDKSMAEHGNQEIERT